MLAGAHAGSLRGRGQGKSASSRPREQPQLAGFASLVDLGLRQSNPFWPSEVSSAVSGTFQRLSRLYFALDQRQSRLALADAR